MLTMFNAIFTNTNSITSVLCNFYIVFILYI
nr:MAG TPA: hypothetical protein [Caudoviricetes sp.]